MESFWIDAHCHLTDDRLRSELETVLKRSEAAHIRRWFLGGVDPREWARQKQISALRPGQFYRSVGLHPWWVASASTETIQTGLAQLEVELSTAKTELHPIHAVGELGLDRSNRVPEASFEVQALAFQAQILLAEKHQLPLVLHIVRAHDEAIRILKQLKPTHGGLVHSYSGSFESAKEYLKLGFILSFSSTVTHPGREKLAQVIARVPSTGFTLESDAPDQPPYEWNEPLNSPNSIIPLAEKIAQLRDPSGKTPGSAILDQSTQNLQRMFHL